MSGDDLISALVEAHDVPTARAIVNDAPRAAVVAAADLLYVEWEGRSVRTLRNAVLGEARA